MPGLWRTRDEVAPIWPGSNHDLGSTWSEESTNFAVWAPEASRGVPLPGRRRGTETRHRLTERTLGIWHGAVPGILPGQRYGYRVAGPWAPAQGLRFNTQKLLLDPYARAVSGELVQDPAIFGYTVGRLRRSRDFLDSAGKVPLSVVVDDRFDWGDDTPRATPVARHRHLRAARQGHDPAARPGARGAARNVRRAGDPGGHRLPARPRRDRGRAAANPPVRHRAGGRRARADQLLGLQLDRLLRPTRGVLLQRGPRPAGHRVQGDGQGPPRSRPRGDPRRGLQPHGRGRGHRADAELPRAGRQDLPPGAAGAGRRGIPRHLLGRDRLRQHRRRQPPLRAADDPRLAALLGHRDARRRLPVRPALRAHPHRPGAGHAQPPAGRHRPGPGAAARQADRRAVGRVHRRLPRRRVPAAVDRVERPVPRRDPGLLERPLRRHPVRRPPGSPGRRTCTPTTAARRTPRSTSSPPTTGSRCATW